jgi:hypothetical protein
MTETEYEAVVEAERAFGRIQVHQQFRALARDLGLPKDCSLPANARQRFPRWYVDTSGVLEAGEQAARIQMRTELAYRFSMPTFVATPARLEYTNVA